MTIGLSLITGSQAMEPESMDVEGGNQISQEQTARELTPTEKKNSYKMWLLKQQFEKSNNEGTLPEVLKDIQTIISQTLHDLCGNPVLNGELLYTDKGNRTSFKIRDLLKEDGCIDLSNPVFGDSSQYFLITTNLDEFFRIVENSYRVLILIAPKSLIDEKIESSAKPFKPIMAYWNEEQAPLGIFYRIIGWEDLNLYDYLTTRDILTISKNNLYENWRHTASLYTMSAHLIVDAPAGCKNFMFVLHHN